MKRILLYIFILLSYTTICPKHVYAQSVINENLVDDDENIQEVGAILHADPRLDILNKKQKSVQLGVIRSGRGYRIQIYNGNDRVKANNIKVDFIRRYPTVRTYLTYVQPQFRVKIGDFKTRGEAEKLFAETNSIYGACMIVPDIIVINNLKDDQ